MIDITRITRLSATSTFKAKTQAQVILLGGASASLNAGCALLYMMQSLATANTSTSEGALDVFCALHIARGAAVVRVTFSGYGFGFPVAVLSIPAIIAAEDSDTEALYRKFCMETCPPPRVCLHGHCYPLWFLCCLRCYETRIQC